MIHVKRSKKAIEPHDRSRILLKLSNITFTEISILARRDVFIITIKRAMFCEEQTSWMNFQELDVEKKTNAIPARCKIK